MTNPRTLARAREIPDGEVDADDNIQALLGQWDKLDNQHRAAVAESIAARQVADGLAARETEIRSEITAILAVRAEVAARVCLGALPAKADDALAFRLHKLNRELDRIDAARPVLERGWTEKHGIVGSIAREIADVDEALREARLDAKIRLIDARAT